MGVGDCSVVNGGSCDRFAIEAIELVKDVADAASAELVYLGAVSCLIKGVGVLLLKCADSRWNIIRHPANTEAF